MCPYVFYFMLIIQEMFLTFFCDYSLSTCVLVYKLL